MNQSSQKLEVSWTALWRIFIFVGFALLLYFARAAFAVLLIGIVLSLGIEPIIAFLSEKLKIGRVMATATVFIVGILTLALVAYIALPILIGEFAGFLAKLNQILPSLPASLTSMSITSVQSGISKVSGFLASINLSFSATFLAILQNIVFIFSTIIVTLYLSMEKNGADRMLQIILPEKYEKDVVSIFRGFEKKMRRWLATQFALSLFVGVMVFLGMFLIGVKYPAILGLLAAILEIVPIIGPVITGALAFVVAAGDSVALAIYAVIFFVLIQQLENHVLVPLLMGKSMKVHPVVVLVSILAGSEVAGFTGIILSVPIAVLVQEIFNYLAEKRSKKLELSIE